MGVASAFFLLSTSSHFTSEMHGPSACVLLTVLVAVLPSVFTQNLPATKTCTEILANPPSDDNQQSVLLCQLSESSTLLAQLGGLVAEGLDRLMTAQGIADDSEETNENSGDLEKRKHEYLRFGKRKHEYLRFGKRKHEYLRFGKRKHEYLRFGRK